MRVVLLQKYLQMCVDCYVTVYQSTFTDLCKYLEICLRMYKSGDPHTDSEYISAYSCTHSQISVRF